MSWFRRMRNVLRPERHSADIAREVAFHLSERTEELRAAGLSGADAEREARRRFGNPTWQRERVRDAGVIGWVDSFLGDVRYAWRGLRRSPAFTLVAVGSLALGIGANTAIYTLIDAVVLRSLPVPHPEELLQAGMGDGDGGDGGGYFTNPLWEQLRDRQTGFTAIAAFSESEFNIAERGEAHRIRGAWVSGDYFTLFGGQPAVGRLLNPTDDARGCPGVAVLAHGFWQSQFGGSRDVVGKTIPLEGKPFVIVGVADEDMTGPEVGSKSQLFAPLCAEAVVRGANSALDKRSNWWMRVIGRREADLSIEQVQARLKAISPASFAATLPPSWAAASKQEYLTRSFTAHDAAHGLSSLRSRYSKALVVLMGAVGLVLLIACANVANLLLARGAAREREVAIRLAIGAAQRRLVRQLFTESAVLALLGGMAGLLLGQWGTRALVALISNDASPVALDLSVNLSVLAFTSGVAMLTATLFGLVPAWRGTRVSPQSAMKAGGRGVAEGHGRFTLGKVLVASQVALSLVLVTGAWLLVGSLRNLATLDPGFRPAGVLIVNAEFRRAGVAVDAQAAAQRAMLERVRTLPGVASASVASLTPMSGSSWNDELVVDGFTPADHRDALSWYNEVSEGYFATIGTRLLAGRDFSTSDKPGGEKVVIVNDAMARKFFGSVTPLGRRFRTRMGDSLSSPVTIVGVVENSKYRTLREESEPIVYVPFSQNDHPGWWLTMIVRRAGPGEPAALVPSIKSALSSMFPAAVLDFKPLSTQISDSLQRERVLATLSALFGGLALLLSMLGLYGVMAYAVARRRNEIGVRIALGAARGRVLRMVLGDVARVTAVGIVLGAAGALASGRLVQSFLYGIAPSDPAITIGSAALLALVALGAGLVPALRAARVDPVAALRED